MDKIKIFEDKKLEIDLPTLIDSRILICANSGGGKSYAVRKILEESNEKVLSIILDIEGEFRTLREEYDFLLIGDDGDVPLNMKSAKLLPEKILGLEIPTIIDISDLKGNERIRYVKEFLEALMQLPRKEGYWKPCLVVLDEVHQLAGQQEKQDSCSAVKDLATRGRKRGYCLVGCTQRIAKLHKDVVAELNNYMVGRTGLDNDMKRASDILGFTNKQDMLSLRDLDAGEFFVFGPAISKKIIKTKIGEVKTTHPKVGMDLRKELIKPTNKVIKILSKLKELPQESEKKLKELNDYKKEIIELKRKLNSKPKPEIGLNSLNKAKQQGYNECKKEMQGENDYLRKENDSFIILMKKIGNLLNFDPIPRKEFKYKSKRFHVPNPVSIPRVTQVTPSVKQNVTSVSDGEYNLNLCERKLYNLLYQYPDRTFSKPQIGVFTGYSHKSGGFSNALSHLRNLGLIEGSGNSLQVKELVSDLAQDFDFSKEAIIGKLSKCEKEIYEVLLKGQDEEFTKEELANNTETQYSFSSGGFSNALSRLNTLGVIKRNNGSIKLNPELLEI